MREELIMTEIEAIKNFERECPKSKFSLSEDIQSLKLQLEELHHDNYELRQDKKHLQSIADDFHKMTKVCVKYQEEIKELNKEVERWKSEYSQVVDRYNEMVDAQPIIEVPQWILCSERFPEEFKRCLTTDAFNNIHIFRHLEYGIFSDGFNRQIDDKHKDYNIPIAWMPLPKPYKEEK